MIFFLIFASQSNWAPQPGQSPDCPGLSTALHFAENLVLIQIMGIGSVSKVECGDKIELISSVYLFVLVITYCRCD